MVDQNITEQKQVALSFVGQRLDSVCAALFPEYSRAQLQAWIKDGSLSVNDGIAKPKQKVSGGEILRLNATSKESTVFEAEDLGLSIVYEDKDIFIVDKPAGLVVHPAAGNWHGTLLNGLLHIDKGLKALPRAGIVHRLDKDTTGLMVVARTLSAQHSLVKQLQARTVSRRYRALVVGHPEASGSVDAPLGRHPKVRTKMAVVKNGGKAALTHYKTLNHYSGYSDLELKLETGRTHQIRVHMAHLGFPLLGDPVYGKALKNQNGDAQMPSLSRQALHAFALEFEHPHTQKLVAWQSQLPEDFQSVLRYLEHL